MHDDKSHTKSKRTGFFLSKQTLDKILRHKRAADMIALLTFYHYTGLWQRTNQPRAAIKFVAKKLRWGEAKARAVKNLLTRSGLIEDLCATDPQTKQITGWYVRLAYFHPLSFDKGGSAKPPSQFFHSVASRYPDALRAITAANGSTEKIETVPELQASRSAALVPRSANTT
jgi:hypothetical protein